MRGSKRRKIMVWWGSKTHKKLLIVMKSYKQMSLGTVILERLTWRTEWEKDPGAQNILVVEISHSLWHPWLGTIYIWMIIKSIQFTHLAWQESMNQFLCNRKNNNHVMSNWAENRTAFCLDPCVFAGKVYMEHLLPVRPRAYGWRTCYGVMLCRAWVGPYSRR